MSTDATCCKGGAENLRAHDTFPQFWTLAAEPADDGEPCQYGFPFCPWCGSPRVATPEVIGTERRTGGGELLTRVHVNVSNLKPVRDALADAIRVRKAARTLLDVLDTYSICDVKMGAPRTLARAAKRLRAAIGE